jgi:hypothetical protein
MCEVAQANLYCAAYLLFSRVGRAHAKKHFALKLCIVVVLVSFILGTTNRLIDPCDAFLLSWECFSSAEDRCSEYLAVQVDLI